METENIPRQRPRKFFPYYFREYRIKRLVWVFFVAFTIIAAIAGLSYLVWAYVLQ